jgi:hypothetical protein
VRAAEHGLRLLRRAAASVGLPDWPPVRLEVMGYTEQTEELRANGWLDPDSEAATPEVLTEFFGDEAVESAPCDLCLVLRNASHDEACPVCLVN